MTDEKYILQTLFKAMFEDKQFLTTIGTVFVSDYFDEAHHSAIFDVVYNHLKDFKTAPQKELVINSVSEDIRENVVNFLNDVDSIDFDVAKNQDWLYENANIYLKDKAIKRAIVKSVDIIDEDGEVGSIRSLIEDALCKDIKVDLGLDYFGQLGERLQRIFTATDHRVTTGYPLLDEYLNGGFPPYTLSVFVAKIHGFKSNMMANIIARQAMKGLNVCLATLEMSQDMFAQRFDSIYSGLDINRIYINKKTQQDLVGSLKKLKQTEGRGNLFVKAYPTGAATVADFRIWLRELTMRDMKPDIFFCDYVNLMKAEYANTGNMYTDVKRIAEELRALGFEFNIPIVSVSQLNREGTFASFEDVDFNYIAESMGLPATADFMMIMGGNTDEMIYQSELHYKIVKNRLGGRVGMIDKLYYDAKSLKMYCSSELEKWRQEASISGDNRDLFGQQTQQAQQKTRKAKPKDEEPKKNKINKKGRKKITEK